MKIHPWFHKADNRRGIALITVVAVLGLATVLLLALFSTTENEYKSTLGYSAGQTARELADSSVNIVMGQIQKGSIQSAAARTIHATQPGAIRKYNLDGSFAAGYKLYSDSRMEVVQPGFAGESVFTGSPPPANWDSQTARYVDLNDPVVRATIPAGGGAAVTEVFFPIVDPRGFTTDTGGAHSIEGFSYTTTPAYSKSGSPSAINGIVTPAAAPGSDPNLQRLPMPVEWLYVLQDGTMGTLDNANSFVPAPGGAVPSLNNPIVGRVAFWTDDESCKVNVNTASESTDWGVPRFFHEREHEWAEKPVVAREYQRFPGHPATVSLSAVLYPNATLDPARDLGDVTRKYGATPGQALRTSADQARLIAIKEQIYKMIPKINDGGSISGTRVFSPDDNVLSTTGNTQAVKVDLNQSSKERLFASLDEMLFSESQLSGTNGRQENQITDSTGAVIFDSKVLEKSRFFLTAHSRSPEFSMLGVPRVGIWPIHKSNDSAHRTPFDRLIAFCGTIKGQSADSPYYFLREQAHSAGNDISIPRNAKLMDYLLKLMQTTMPASGSATGTSFSSKYGDDNAHQILIEIFDYIRSTNLYDDILSPNVANLLGTPGSVGTVGNPGYKSAERVMYEQSPTVFNSFTNPLMTRNRTLDGSTAVSARQVADNGWPGHGQVTPSQWKKNGKTYMGIGRNITLSEIGFQFICTADGANDANSYTAGGVTSGGATCDRINTVIPNQYQFQGTGAGKAYPYFATPSPKSYWYSNYPPFPGPNRFGALTSAPPNDPRNPNRHPAYDPNNWNVTLDRDTPLNTDEKRIQALLNLELFCPAEGWTLIHPEFTIVLNGDYINAITVNGQNIFATSQSVVVKSRSNVYTTYNVNRTGGVTPPRALYDGYNVKQIKDMPADAGYENSADSSIHAKMANCDLVSNFITVKRNEDMNIVFPAGRTLKVDIYDTHNWSNSTPVQSFDIDLAQVAGTNTIRTPTPTLGKKASERKEYYDSSGKFHAIRAVEGPRWWCFNYDGAIGRYYRQGPYTPTYANVKETKSNDSSNGLGERVLGRFASVEGYSIFYQTDNTGDIIRSAIPAMGDYRLVAARNSVPGSMWKTHRWWTDRTKFTAHNYSSHYGNTEAGVDLGDGPGAEFLTNLIGSYSRDKVPDMPRDSQSLAALNSYFDFDNGVGTTRDGAYINKPDEGNFSKLNFKRNLPPYNNRDIEVRNAYFTDSWEMEPDKSAGDTYFTPNRMISSPVMFGSLPSAVFNGSGNTPQGYNGEGRPWQTLLFRPHVKMGDKGAASHPGAQSPADHYILDMFTMPVVEPYAISEPLSQAGKININYQILPFTYINRATGLWAAMKNQIMEAIPQTAIDGSPNYKTFKSSSVFPPTFWDESDGAYWHRRIDVAETLKQLGERFNFNSSIVGNNAGLLRSASQVCELHLVPRPVAGETNTLSNMTPGDRESKMADWWGKHSLTGDNSREKPYSDLYAKLTTRSNTFRVHMRAQVLKKARDTSPTEFSPTKDAILSEYRGSTLIERYIDPNDTTQSIPDYADGGPPLSKASLDTFYRFRVIENKRFAP
jgi:uncharacterized protein (TIGR02600 family)